MAKSGKDRQDTPQRSTFGQVAVRKGFATQQQVKDALERQVRVREETGKHKLIGLVMLEMGILGTTELIDILKDMNRMPDAVTAVKPRPSTARKTRRKATKS